MIGEFDNEIPKHQTGPSAKDLGSRHCPGEEDESGHRLGPILQQYVQLDGDADKSTPHPLQTQVTLWVWNTPTDRIIPIDKKSLNNFGDAELSPLCQITSHLYLTQRRWSFTQSKAHCLILFQTAKPLAAVQVHQTQFPL